MNAAPLDATGVEAARRGPPPMKVCISIDLDNYQDYESLVGSGVVGSPPSFYSDALPRFLDLFDEYGVKATFFAIGRDLLVPENSRALRDAAERGHEIANHSHTHPYNFRALSEPQRAQEIDQADAAIADAVGMRPVGFRTPSCEGDILTLRILEERGYEYDSSIFSTPLMWAFMLYGKLFVRRPEYSLGPLSAPFAPITPYVPSSRTLVRRRAVGDTGPARIVEIPFSCLPLVRIPFYSTLLRRLGKGFFSALLRAYGQRPELHVLFHVIELADFEGTSLGEAFERTPALALPFEERKEFLGHAVSRLAAAGEAVPMRELARSFLRSAPA